MLDATDLQRGGGWEFRVALFSPQQRPLALKAGTPGYPPRPPPPPGGSERGIYAWNLLVGGGVLSGLVGVAAGRVVVGAVVGAVSRRGGGRGRMNICPPHRPVARPQHWAAGFCNYEARAAAPFPRLCHQCHYLEFLTRPCVLAPFLLRLHPSGTRLALASAVLGFWDVGCELWVVHRLSHWIRWGADAVGRWGDREAGLRTPAY